MAEALLTDADQVVSLVTITRDNGRPEISSTPVASAAEAAQLATATASSESVVSVDVAQPVMTATTYSASNDTFRSTQWALNQLKPEAIWPRVDGTGVTVAVIDTGVQPTHEDLVGQVLAGATFLGGGAGVPGGYSGAGSGHGTHVAGILAARANNNRGIAGLAPGSKILPVKVLSDDGAGTDVDVSNGMIWAVDNGADILSLSLSGYTNSAAFQTGVAYALSHNVTVVAAGGNDGNELAGGTNRRAYPAAIPGVIAVAATGGSAGSSMLQAPYSTSGNYIALSAPGTLIYSTVPTANTGAPGSPYLWMSGTSMATPYVSAAAALVLQERPDWSPAQIRAGLMSTALDLGAAGQDPDFGAGQVQPRVAVGC